jgi:gas vesicle protein
LKQIDIVASTRRKKEREDQTIKKSVEGGLLLVLRLVNEDVKELIPRFKEPWKESMTHLTNHIELVQSQVIKERARTR